MVARARGVTLLEVLVVVSIVALLAAILAPVLAEAKARVLMTKSVSNMKQIGAALLLYQANEAEPTPPFFSLPPTLLALRESMGLPVGLFRTGGSDFLYPGQPAVYTWMVPRRSGESEAHLERWLAHLKATENNPVILLDETFPGTAGRYRFDSRRATGMYLDTRIKTRWATGSLSQYEVWE